MSVSVIVSGGNKLIAVATIFLVSQLPWFGTFNEDFLPLQPLMVVSIENKPSFGAWSNNLLHKIL